jgi:hypothetical protein
MLGLTMEHYDLTMENGRFNMIEPSNMMIWTMENDENIWKWWFNMIEHWTLWL